MAPLRGIKPQRAWTKDELDFLVDMRENHQMKFIDIAEHFPGRTRKQCESRYRALVLVRDGVLPEPESMRASSALAARISDEALKDRDARKAASEARSFTQTFCGDPPIGYSALDRRKEMA